MQGIMTITALNSHGEKLYAIECAHNLRACFNVFSNLSDALKYAEELENTLENLEYVNARIFPVFDDMFTGESSCLISDTKNHQVYCIRR